MTSRTTAGYPTGRARRARIIEGATLQFARSGFRSATMVEIAAACGISRAGLLHHFPTKESLLEAVLEARDVADRHRMIAQRETSPADGLGLFRGMVDLAAHNATVPGIVALYAVLSAESGEAGHPAHEYFIERYRQVRAESRIALQLAREAGYLRPDIDIEVQSVQLTALMDGLQVQWLLDPSVDMAHQIRLALENLLTVPLFPTGPE